MDDAELRENLKRLAAWANSQGATIGLHAIEAVHRIDELTRIASRLEADEDDVERVARAIARASIEAAEPETGRLSAEGINQLVEHFSVRCYPEARAAILAMRRAAQEKE